MIVCALDNLGYSSLINLPLVVVDFAIKETLFFLEDQSVGALPCVSLNALYNPVKLTFVNYFAITSLLFLWL